MASSRRSVRDLVLSAMFLALGLLLPFATAQIPQIGSALLPMHIPVLLCGFLCGWPYGLMVGFVTPLLRSLLFGMPPMMPTAVAMAFELAAYGALSGVIMKRLPRNAMSVVIALVVAMLGGRVVWGVVSYVLYLLMGNAFSWQLFAAGAFTRAIPGIIAQVIIIPAVTLAVWKVDKTAA